MRNLHRLTTLSLVLAAALTSACGASVTVAEAPTDAAPTVVDAAVVVEPSALACADVRAACGPSPMTFVRGHAAGLTGLDGARVRFAMRYLPTDGADLDGAHGVVVAGSTVRDGAFEACVCMPRGANGYPQVVAVVFAPGSTGDTSRDVARAVFSPRYATLGDEDVSQALATPPSAPAAEAAIAGLVDRSRSLSVTGFDGAALDGATLFGGVVADERPVAAQVATTSISFGAATLRWDMPGRAWPTERVALVVDRNADRRCDAGDLGAIVTPGAAETFDLAGVAWARGAALDRVCAALRLDDSR